MSDQSHFVALSNLEELEEEGLIINLRLPIFDNLILVYLRHNWLQQLKVCEPLRLIIDMVCDQLAQVSVAVMDPFPWVDSWLDHHE